MLLDDFEVWARQAPNAPALYSDGQLLSYAQVRAMSLGIARMLEANGVMPNDRVILHLPKGTLAVIGMLAVLYAGAAYVPIDPRAPTARIAQILEAAAPRAVIGHGPFVEQLAAFDRHLFDAVPSLFVDRVCLDRALVLDPPSTSVNEWENRPRVDAQAPAYLLFTSGTTGVPKGVVVSHHGACRFVDWARRTFALGPTQRLTNFAPLSFDLSILDLFGAWSSGASVYLVPPELLLRPKQLVDVLAQWAITTLYAVPSTITLLEREGQLECRDMPNLRQVLYAGEPFPIPALVAAMQALPRARFFNLFGPTETNVCTCFPIPAVPPLDAAEVSIGYACDHLNVQLLDGDGRPVPDGEEGELCVAGPSVMTEYFRDSSATEAAFHRGALFDDGQRRYRTGDRATADPSGRFWFRGRRDRLVKRRGYRVELGEIEMALSRHPAVQQAAAVARNEGGETRIRAFVVLQAQGPVTTLILRAHCGSLLPPYMVPDSVTILNDMPRTLTGKVDLQSLQQWGHNS